MKKLLLSIAVICSLYSVSMGADLVQMTLLDHVSPVTQFKNGETKIALVDSIVRIGSYKGKSILDLQAGFNGETKPDAGEVSGVSLLGGGFLKVSSLVGSVVKYPEHWQFLKALEHGPSLFYDFREKTWQASYQVGLAFSLQPKS